MDESKLTTPEFIHAVLRDRHRLIVLPYPNSPLVELRFYFQGGFASDPSRLCGLTGYAVAALMDAFSQKHGPIVTSLGAAIGVRHYPDGVVFTLSALSANFTEVLKLFLSAFSFTELSAQHLEVALSSRLNLIEREKKELLANMRRVLPQQLYPRNHPLRQPFSGSGTESGIRAITDNAFNIWCRTHLFNRPAIAAGVGTFDIALFSTLFDQAGARWPSSMDLISDQNANLSDEQIAQIGQVALIDSRNTDQSLVCCALPLPPLTTDRAAAFLLAEAVLSGMFTSRVNLALREERGWTYGVRSTVQRSHDGGHWEIVFWVDARYTVEAIALLENEIERFVGNGQCSTDEFSRVLNYVVAREGAQFDTCAGAADAILEHALAGNDPPNHLNRLREFESMTISDVLDVSRATFEIDKLRYVVGGNRASIVPQLQNRRRSFLIYE